MNYSTAVMLFNEDIRAVNVIYEPDTDSLKQKRTIFKTTDKAISAGDLVIVPTDTRHNFTVAKVSEEDVEIDFQASEKIGWIAGKADIQSYGKIIETEKTWIDAIKASEKRKQREDIKKNMIDMAKEQGIDLGKLANTSLSGLTAIEGKK